MNLDNKKKTMLMNSISGELTNLLDEISYVENYYINNNGDIAPSSSSSLSYKTIVSDYIETEYLDSYVYFDIFNSEQTQYVHIAFYDENKNKLGTRTTIIGGVTNSIHASAFKISDSSAKYFRINPRTYGDISVGLYKAEDIDLFNRNISY